MDAICCCVWQFPSQPFLTLSHAVMSYTPLAIDETQVTRVRRFPNGGFLSVQTNGDFPSFSYAYGPAGLKGLFANPFTFASALFASIGGLTFGYDQGVIANLLVMANFKQHFPVTPFQQGALTAVLELGALIGALTCGTYGDTMSRRKAIRLACAIFCVGSSIQTIANTLNFLGWGRFIGGIGIGSLSMLSPLYMSEISPPEFRGSLLALEQLSIVFGVVLGFWLGFFTRTIPGSLSWRIPLFVQLIPGALLAIGSFMLPPSPRYLVAEGKGDEAEVTLRKLRMASDGLEELVQIELIEMKVEAAIMDMPDREVKGYLSAWSRVFEPKFRKQTLIGAAVMFFQQWTGINAVLFYGPALMRSMGLQGDTVMLVSSGFVNITQFLAVIPAIVFIDRLGRRPLLMTGAILMAISHAIIAGLVLYGHTDWAQHQTAAWFAVGMIYVFTASYGVSFGPVSWVLPNEIFPLTVRSKGVGLSTASNWTNNFFVGLLTPPLIATSPSGTYMVFSFSCLAAFFWSWLVVPETKGRSLEEMDSLFNSDAGAEGASLKRELEQRLGLWRQVELALGETRGDLE
ncbi:general substrate transporter [Clavulina sp. PMI_390]|nr:general substrate transporter [Clavulina sp. PMI_390]